MPITEHGIVFFKDRTTGESLVTTERLWREIYKLRADMERIGEEFATMKVANAELQERLSAALGQKTPVPRVSPGDEFTQH